MTVPKSWAHGEIPAHTDLQKDSDLLDELYAAYLPYNRNPAVLSLDNIDPQYGNVVKFDPYAFRHWFRHGMRYLHYQGTGKIVDPTEVEEDVPLSAGESGYGVLDLDSVVWLAYGQEYQVQSCLACFEDRTP